MRNQKDFQTFDEEKDPANVKQLDIQKDIKYQEEIDAEKNSFNQDGLHIQEKKSDKIYTGLMSQKDLMDFKNSYMKFKSKWAFYIPRFNDKNQAQLKNFFHNSLRRLSSQFIRAERANRIFQKSSVSPIFLHNIIDISLMAKSFKTERNYILNTVSDKILYCLYDKTDPGYDELLDACKAVRTMHSFIKHMKCLKKFIQNEQVLKNIALFILKKEENLLPKRKVMVSNETQQKEQGIKETIKQQVEEVNPNQNEVKLQYGYFPQNFENYSQPDFLAKGCTPEGYMNYWSTIPYCFYPYPVSCNQEIVKEEVKSQEPEDCQYNKFCITSSSNDECKIEN